MHKAFISYHNKHDYGSKQQLQALNSRFRIYDDKSVDTSNIDDNLDDLTIREIIRDNYLRDSTVGEDQKTLHLYRRTGTS